MTREGPKIPNCAPFLSLGFEDFATWKPMSGNSPAGSGDGTCHKRTLEKGDTQYFNSGVALPSAVAASRAWLSESPQVKLETEGTPLEPPFSFSAGVWTCDVV